ncbi:hypothetical protein WS46_23355 [Burkholderia sp. RF4-BP95]|nr:hypothetical protein WS46_23355 [Burkholderia sp. RF4-BP95]
MQRTEGKRPDDPNYDFKRLYQEVKKRGYIPYPGKLTEVDTFRVGCIGHFGEPVFPARSPRSPTR